MANPVIEEALTFDDILLVPAYSEILPREVDLKSRLTRNISLNIPIVSAAMDTVSDAQTCISLVREGGIGIIHRNMSVESQVREVDKVKKSESGMIVDPMTIEPRTFDEQGRPVGGAAGNTICVHNVVAASAVVGLLGKESLLIRKTIIPMTYYLFVSGALGFALLWWFRI